MTSMTDQQLAAASGSLPTVVSEAHASQAPTILPAPLPTASSSATSNIKLTAACSACRTRKIKCPGETPCANCIKYQETCIYPPVATRKRRMRDRDRIEADLDAACSRVQSSATVGGGDPNQNISHWQNQLLQGRALPNQPMQSQPLHGMDIPSMFPTPMGTLDLAGPSWSSPNGQALWTAHTIPEIPGASSTEQSTAGFESLESLLALDPAFPNPFDSPTAAQSNASSGHGGSFAQSKRVKFRVPYFRFFGPTAIAPGYKQVTSNVSRAPSPTFRDMEGLLGRPILFGPAPYDDFPHLDALQNLIPIFYEHFSYFFSFIHIHPPTTYEEMSRYAPSLLNMMCALAARYSPKYGGIVPRQGMGNDLSVETEWEESSGSWASKAKEQAGRNLAVSSVEMVQTLLMIAWHEFGGDRDSGLWMYSGMALRMAQDLGLDALGRSSGPDAPGAVDHRRLHGGLRLMDSLMTIGTGRAGMFQHPEWTIPSFAPLVDKNGLALPDLYEHVMRVLVIADNITGILIQDPSLSKPKETLVTIQKELSEFYGELPTDLRFQASTLQVYASIAQGAAFVLLHIWFHALIILSYCPNLLVGDTLEDKEDATERASIEVAASSAKSILDIMSFAELIDAKAICQPWVNYPLYLAGRAFSPAERGKPDTVSVTGAQAHIARAAKQDFLRVISMFRMVEKYWKGVRYIIRALDQKAEGIQHVDIADEVQPLPADILALLERASSRSTSDAVGLSLVGTVNSPTDNQYGLVFPSWAGTPIT